MAKKIPYEAYLKLETGTHTARINRLLVTPDGKSLITAGGDKTIRLWDIESKKQSGMLLGQIGTGGHGNIQAITISPDGRYLVALAWLYPDAAQDAQRRETDFRVYELATGNLQAGFRYPGTLQDLDFSLDGRYLALAGNPNDTRQGLVMVYETKKVLKGFGRMPAPVSTTILYENDLIPSYVRFIPEKRGRDGSYRLVAAPWEHWRPGAPEYSGRIFWFKFSASAKITTMINREIDGQVAPNSLTVSSHFVIVTAEETAETRSKNFYCYDHDGHLVNVVESETFPARPAFSHDGNQLIVGQREDSAIIQVKVYDTAFGQFPLKSTYFGHDSTVLGTAFLGDNLVVSAGGDQNAIHFWSTSHMEGEKTAEISGAGRVLHVVGISADEQIGFGYRDDLRLKDGTKVLQRAFDLRAMTLKSFPFQRADEFHRAQKTHENRSLDFSERNNWNLQVLPDGNYFSSPLGWYNVSTYGFTEDGAVVAGSPDGKVRYTPRSPQGYGGVSERLLLGHESTVLDHASCGKWLVTAGADQVIRLWYLEDAENENGEHHPALNLFAGSDDEWVIWSKSGYYNASQRGDRRFGYHINRGSTMESLFFPSDRFIKSFFRPDIIQTILETGSEERALAKLKAQEVSAEPVDVSRILPPIVELARNGITRQKDKVTFKFTVEELNPEQPVTRVWIVQNDKFAWQAGKRAKTFKVILSLLPGQNRFKILAETENTKAMPLILDMMGPEPKVRKGGVLGESGSARGMEEKGVASSTLMETREPGWLFLLAVGVSEFSDIKSEVKFLKYADDDAEGVFNAFGRGDLTDRLEAKGKDTIRTKLKNKAFESVEATILTNQFATKKAILNEVQRICDELGKRAKAKKPKRDVFMVFLSGHGVRLVGGPINDLYFWNYDAVFNDLENTGLSFMKLGEKVTCVPAEVILATDACHSGMAGRDVVRELDANELAKRIYAINERGLYILNAARSEEKAQEFDQINHGVFARSILDGLNKQANPDISMIGLMDYVQRQMRYYMGVKQTPVFRTYGDLLPLTIYNK